MNKLPILLLILLVSLASCAKEKPSDCGIDDDEQIWTIPSTTTARVPLTGDEKFTFLISDSIGPKGYATYLGKGVNHYYNDSLMDRSYNCEGITHIEEKAYTYVDSLKLQPTLFIKVTNQNSDVGRLHFRIGLHTQRQAVSNLFRGTPNYFDSLQFETGWFYNLKKMPALYWGAQYDTTYFWYSTKIGIVRVQYRNAAHQTRILTLER